SGSTVYAGGLFTSIGGQTRNRIAALDASTGLATSWNPNANSNVYALAVSGSTVYAGGAFTSVGGQTRNYIAALDASTGGATSWDPNANGGVVELAFDLANARVYAGGAFTGVLNNAYGYFVGLTDPYTEFPPAAPQALAVTDSSSGGITIKWRKNTEADFLRYRIYRNTSPNPTTKVDSTSGGITDTTKTFLDVTNGTRYYLRVTAVDSSGNESGYSNEVNAAPGDRVAPAAPQNLVVTDSTSGTITIKWRKNTEPDFLRYRIYRATSPAPTSKVDSTTSGVTDTTRTFTGLINGTRYYFRVTAVDSAGNESFFSDEVNAAPADRIAPAAPQDLVVTDSTSGTITIKWRK
ncbi:MAG: fibronectin type III domain-containing protein, partial [Ignavibacteriales bacterium]|nr:fibronectin type III domain-containing protein [Ignavibacteriales bacterium]